MHLSPNSRNSNNFTQRNAIFMLGKSSSVSLYSYILNKYSAYPTCNIERHTISLWCAKITMLQIFVAFLQDIMFSQRLDNKQNPLSRQRCHLPKVNEPCCWESSTNTELGTIHAKSIYIICSPVLNPYSMKSALFLRWTWYGFSIQKINWEKNCFSLLFDILYSAVYCCKFCAASSGCECKRESVECGSIACLSDKLQSMLWATTNLNVALCTTCSF